MRNFTGRHIPRKLRCAKTRRVRRGLRMRWWLTIACTSAAVGFAWLAGASGAGADPWKTTARYALEYRVHLADLAPSGTKARLWVPYPAANRDQKILDAQIESPWPWKL